MAWEKQSLWNINQIINIEYQQLLWRSNETRAWHTHRSIFPLSYNNRKNHENWTVLIINKEVKERQLKTVKEITHHWEKIQGAEAKEENPKTRTRKQRCTSSRALSVAETAILHEEEVRMGASTDVYMKLSTMKSRRRCSEKRKS